jgi:hypothetical protein
MDITTAQYIASYTLEGILISSQNSVKATIEGVEMWVPIEAGNRHYAEILRQVAAGTLTIQEAD